MMDALVPKCGHFLSYPSSQTDTTDIPKDLITCVRARETDSECQSFGSLLFPFSSACRNQRKITSSSSKSSAGAHRRMTDTTGTTGFLRKVLAREEWTSQKIPFGTSIRLSAESVLTTGTTGKKRKSYFSRVDRSAKCSECCSSAIAHIFRFWSL